MKIKVALLESDKTYLSRIINAFQLNYSDKLELYSFTSEEAAMKALTELRIDVFLAGDTFAIETDRLPVRCGFAYLVDSPGIESIAGNAVICKFQKAELIYKQILSIFSEKSEAVTGTQQAYGNANIVAFTAAAGGVGCSSAAAAYALTQARAGRKTFYFDLEPMGNPELFFHGEGQESLSDVLYAVKSKKKNLYLKLESAVRKDSSNVAYLAATQTPLDMIELRNEEVNTITRELLSACGYECIVMDLGFQMNDFCLGILDMATRVVAVTDGIASANGKTERMLAALSVFDAQKRTDILHKTGILYNRFGSKSSVKLANNEVGEYGGIRRFEGAASAQLPELIANENIGQMIN